MKFVLLAFLAISAGACGHIETRVFATGDLGVVIERATGSVQVVNTSQQSSSATIKKIGDLSHASVVFSRDEQFAYVFARDGGLTKLDLTQNRIDRHIIQGGNSIGGAISQNGKWIAVSNYEPGGIKIFNAKTLSLVADIPAEYAPGKMSKTVGLVDAPGNKFIFSLYDGDAIWIADLTDPDDIQITKFPNIGHQPYDGLITPDGRYYMAGLFGEDGLALLDLWHQDKGVRKILADYGKDSKKLPVYKMPHLEGWAIAGSRAFFPAVGRNEVLVMDMRSWKLESRIPVSGQPVFVMSQPDNRNVWVNFSFPNNDRIEVINSESLEMEKLIKPGKGVLHMEFTPRGEHVWVSVRDDNKVVVYDTQLLKPIATLPAQSPSGIFFTNRAHQIGL